MERTQVTIPPKPDEIFPEDTAENEEVRFNRAISRMSSFAVNPVAFGEQLNVDGEIASHLSKSVLGSPERALDLKMEGAPIDPILSLDPFSDKFDLMAWVRNKRVTGELHGFNATPIALTFKDLETYGDRVSKREISTFASPFQSLLSGGPFRKCFVEEELIPSRCLMRNFTGYVIPGEMTLVLGRPGAGCSTLLRTLAGVNSGLSEIKGDIRYNGISQSEFISKFPSFLTYNPEDDLHYPTLSVKETLRFALECKTGAAVPKTGETKEQARRRYIEEHIQVYLRVFGLLNCADTKVGNEIIRGCSGGEKKRVSITEQLCIGASLGFWDGSTKGLDASTALDFVRALRVLTDLSAQAQVVSLYQASEDIYELFDNVCLVADGRVVYFGPGKEAKDYFVGLGFVKPNRKVTPDFLTGITELKERDVQVGKEDIVPKTIEEFENAYKASSVYKAVVERINKIDEEVARREGPKKFPETVIANKRALGIPEHLMHSEYSTTFGQQFRAVCKREFTLSKRDVTTIGIMIFDYIMALIVGFVFFQLPVTASGAFSRGGVIFFSMIYMCFNALSAVPLIVQGRAINGKHRSYHLYRTHMQTFCTQMTNVPMIFSILIGFSILIYWICGLRANAGAFFTFILILFVANQAFGSLVRTVSSLMPDMNTAMMANSILILTSTTFSGYIIPKPMMTEWAKFIFWLNPVQWAVRGLLENEYHGLKIPCDGSALVPGTAYASAFASGSDDVSKLSACMITGSEPGDAYVEGVTYIQHYFDFGNYNLYWNVLILIGYIVFNFTSMIYINKYFGVVAPAYSVNVWKRKKVLFNLAFGKQTVASVDTDSSNSVVMSVEDIVKKTAAAFESNSESFTWKHVNYTVTLPDGTERQLLKDVHGYVKSGQMVALMGSSGAGKTTLMDCITQRKTTGKLDGQIYVGNKPQSTDFRSITSYCEQIDVHNSFSTVRESVRFSAHLRQPDSVPLSEKYAFADLVITLLELDNIADAMVGRPNSANGISMEERKRLTIACELASKPKILFLDEPTSGLDSQAAYTIIRLLRNLADRGQAILCTIHQPSAVIFEKFDKLLLLARGGLTVYFGELGKDCSAMINYFESNGADKCPPAANPAEYMLDCIGAGVSGQKPAQDWVELWTNSDVNRKLADDVDEVRLCNDKDAVTHTGTSYGEISFKMPIYKQIPIVYGRMMTSFFRNPNYNWGRVFMLTYAGLFLGFSFFQTEETTRGTTLKLFAIFGSVTISALFINLSQPNYHEMRNVFLRERETGVYDWRAFYIAITSCEWPWVILCSTCFFPSFYYLIGLSHDSDRAFFFWIMFCLFNLNCTSLGQLIISGLPALQFATGLNPLFMSIQMVLSGVAQPFTSMPKFWHWIYWVNPFHYFIEGVIGNEIGLRPIKCDEKSGMMFLPPTGYTCGQYMSTYLSSGAPGALMDENATDLCRFCNFKDGDEMLNLQMGNWKFEHRWRNFGFVAAFFVFNLIAISFFIKKFKVSR